jgi:voltage-gated potassium channel
VRALLLVLAGAAVARDAERSASGGNITSYGDAVWWAMTTATTVGYGGRYPVTTTGRVVAVGLMLVGIALLGIVTASLAAAFSRWTAADAQEVAAAEATRSADLATVLEELRALRAEVALLRAQSAETKRAGTGDNRPIPGHDPRS